MIRVLVADNDLDSHELIDDILQINFRDPKIERVHTPDSFAEKVSSAVPPYNLILYSVQMDIESGQKILAQLLKQNPDLSKRMVLMGEDKDSLPPDAKSVPNIPKPISLDYFGEVVKKACGS